MAEVEGCETIKRAKVKKQIERRRLIKRERHYY
jgi:hypothetical protein